MLELIAKISKKLLSVLWCFGCTCTLLGCGATSSGNLSKARLVDATSYHATSPTIRYLQDIAFSIDARDRKIIITGTETDQEAIVNAAITRSGELQLSFGLLARVSSEAQLAFVIAHELAHETLQHFNNHQECVASCIIEREYAADMWAFDRISAMGYSQRDAVQAILQVEYRTATTHPSKHQRISRLINKINRIGGITSRRDFLVFKNSL